VKIFISISDSFIWPDSLYSGIQFTENYKLSAKSILDAPLTRLLSTICDCEYATKMHTALNKKYNVQSVARPVQLQMELQKVYQKYEETFADYYQ
jgi:hypothetical protein